MKIVISGIVALVAFVGTAFACDLAVGTSAARDIENTVNTLVETHRSQCRPAADGARCSVICVSQVRVVNYDGWLLVAGAAGGLAARERGLDRFSYVSLIDRNLGEDRKYLRIDIAKASAVQQRMVAGRVDGPTGLAQMKAAASIQSIGQ
ncbi:MAG: hypothetical protein ACK5X0_00930 [Rhodospirillales bacterium]|jgi:hypothetical protein